ncbi:cytochrome P450 [Hygrophoropsis aurantiaca]|uniref:Cytochrome P450 n=1 Tax=Hygrophoropsis aurantiaca TaxID=72124 RepID=A0ACB8AIJ6_9AGAM|nr:cytochrome P450 [Hygrophoropsis aurantiaca]
MAWSSDNRLVFLLPISLTAIALATFVTKKRNAVERLPPGPTPLPLVGNVLSLDSQEPWNTYAEWGVAHGDLIYARFLNQDVIIINSEKVAKDLLEKRSQIYSDRPFIATLKPFGWSFNFAFTPYGDEWRLARRLFHQTFRVDAAQGFRPMQLSKAHQLLINLIEDPASYIAHMETFSASVAMASLYDYDTKPRKDPLVAIVNRALELGCKVMTPERAILLGAFPFLLRIPTWFPGATIKRDATLSCESVEEMIEKPFEYVENSMISGTAGPSLVSNCLQKMESEDAEHARHFKKAIKDVSATAFVGGSESTSSVLQVFVLAMVLNPSVQERARAEIDAVLGGDRLPGFDDRSSLPYIDAVVRETIRWQPVAPSGVPHSTMEDDIYNGYFIPKGATIIQNIWGMSRDESVYPNANDFNPDRWLDSKGQLADMNPPDFVFGFGRRVCPGRHVADASVWGAIASMLATFEFLRAKDPQGKDIEFVPSYTVGLARHPIPFPLSIAPCRANLNKDKLIQMIHSST